MGVVAKGVTDRLDNKDDQWYRVDMQQALASFRSGRITMSDRENTESLTFGNCSQAWLPALDEFERGYVYHVRTD